MNKVRNRANFANLQNVAMDDVEHEGVLELALKGRRFYNLLRWGELSKHLSDLTASDPYFKKFISGTDYKGSVTNKHEWLPILLSEVNNDSYVTKNSPNY